MNAAEGGDCRLTQGLGRGLAGRGGGRRARGPRRSWEQNAAGPGAARPGAVCGRGGRRGGGTRAMAGRGGPRGPGRPPRAGGGAEEGNSGRPEGGAGAAGPPPPPPPEGSAEKLGGPRPGRGKRPGSACLPAAFPGAGRLFGTWGDFPPSTAEPRAGCPRSKLSPERTPGLAAAGCPRPGGERPCPRRGAGARPETRAGRGGKPHPQNNRSGRTASRVNGIASDGQRGSAGGTSLFTSPRR